MALSLLLHGLAVAPLLLAGTSGSAPADEVAFEVEISLAAPASAPAEAASEQSAPEPQPPIELPPPEEPPPLDTTSLKPVEPPKPPPPPVPPKPAPPKPAARAAAAPAVATPNEGTAATTQQAAASQPLVVFERRPKFRTPPKPAAYPPRAVELNQQGEALIRVRLEPDGSAVEIVLWRGSGFELLDRAAIAAVRGWQFLPAVRDGRAVAAWVEIPIRFHLR